MIENPTTQRRRIDWEAVERDYRTGKFTQTELAAKHNIDPATLSRKIRTDREASPDAWQQDLTAAVRQATNARIMAEMVKSEINNGQDQVKDVIKAAAEMGAQVIRKHKARLDQLNKDADTARQKLLSLGDAVANIREAAAFVSAVEASARTVKIVIEAERKAFGIDEEGGGDDKGAQLTVVVRKFSDA